MESISAGRCSRLAGDGEIGNRQRLFCILIKLGERKVKTLVAFWDSLFGFAQPLGVQYKHARLSLRLRGSANEQSADASIENNLCGSKSDGERVRLIIILQGPAEFVKC